MRNGLTPKWRKWRTVLSSRVDILTRHFGRMDLPIPLAGIATCCKVRETIFRPLLVEGGLALDGDGFIIYVRSEETEIEESAKAYREPRDQGRSLSGRTRFTLAHEIAHTFFFDTSRGRPRARVTGSHPAELRSLERECNIAAAKLLMPEHLLNQIIKREEVDVFEPTEMLFLARRFGVSVQALVRRIRALSLWSNDHGGVLYICQESGRPVVRAAAITGLAWRSFPEAKVGVDARKLFYHSDLVVYGGSRREVEWCNIGGGCEAQPWKVVCARMSRRYNDYLVSIRFLD